MSGGTVEEMRCQIVRLTTSQSQIDSHRISWEEEEWAADGVKF